MTTSSSWTLERCELVGKLVRRSAFDFDAASIALRAHLKNEGVHFSFEETSPTSLRKVFASLDRKSTSKSIPVGYGLKEENSRKDSTAGGTLRAQHSIAGTKGEDTNPAPSKQDQQRGDASPTSDLSNHSDETRTGTAATPSPSPPPSSSTSKPAWDFESFLEDQRRKKLQHDHRKEKVFQKVLLALGGNGDLTTGAPGLPTEIIQAWGARNEKLSVEAGNSQKRQQKLEEDRVLAIQRQSLRQRHLPGSDDRVGEDPLGPIVDGTTSTPSGQERKECGELPNDEPIGEQHQDGISSVNEAPAGPVRLELGIDADVLDKILDEIEESALAAGGPRETNSELSRVLDELDLAAANDTSSTTAPVLAGFRE